MVQGRAGSGNVVPLMVRVPEDLRDRIKAAADKNGRSQNSEIVETLLEKYPAPSEVDLNSLAGILRMLTESRDTDGRNDELINEEVRKILPDARPLFPGTRGRDGELLVERPTLLALIERTGGKLTGSE